MMQQQLVLNSVDMMRYDGDNMQDKTPSTGPHSAASIGSEIG
jgi:hypothetical protein